MSSKTFIPPQCHLCLKWFTSQTAVVRHLNKEHSNNGSSGKWPCIICGKLYTRRNTLARHVTTIHNDNLPTPALVLCRPNRPSPTIRHYNPNITPSNVRFRIVSANRPYVFRAKQIPLGREKYYFADGRPNPAVSLPRKPTRKTQFADALPICYHNKYEWHLFTLYGDIR